MIDAFELQELLACSGNGCQHLRVRVVQAWQHSPSRPLKIEVRNLSVELIKFTVLWNGILGGGSSEDFDIPSGSTDVFTAPNGLVGATITNARIIDTRPKNELAASREV